MTQLLDTIQTDVLAQIVSDLLSPNYEDNLEGCQKIDDMTGLETTPIFEAVSLTIKTLKVLQGSTSTRDIDALAVRAAAHYEQLCRSP